jgi:hypothetical protein
MSPDRSAAGAMILPVEGDALWNFLTWGHPEGIIAALLSDLVVLALLGLLVWAVKDWRRQRRQR